MKKLEDIPKKQVFSVPAGYFDKLPLAIQSRIEAKEHTAWSNPFLAFSLKYALPVVLLTVVSVFMYQSQNNNADAEVLLADVSSEALIQYLQEVDVSTDELLAEANLTTLEAENIESEVYMNLDFTENDLLELDI